MADTPEDIEAALKKLNDKEEPPPSHPKAYIIDGTGENGKALPGDDLHNVVLNTIGSYLRSTYNKRNKTFIMGVGGGPLVLTDDPIPGAEKTPPLSIPANQGTFRTQLISGGNTDAAEHQYSDSFFFDRGEESLSDFISKSQKTGQSQLITKIKPQGDLHSPNHFLQNPGDPRLAPVQGAIALALEDNRFNPSTESTPFIRDGKLTKGIAGVQNKLGSYDANAEAAKLVDLSQIALGLMQVSTHDERITNPVDFDKDNALIPNLNQVGIPKGIPTADLTAESVMRRMGIFGTQHTGIADSAIRPPGKEEGWKDEGLSKYLWKEPDTNSYGSLNSPFEPFSGPMPLGMAIVAATSLVSLGIVGYAVTFLLDALLNDLSFGPAIKDDRGYLQYEAANPMGSPPSVMKYGDHIPPTGTTSKLVKRWLSIPDYRHQFEDAFLSGIMTFFGFPIDADAEDIIEGLADVLFSGGYYAVVMRNAIRDSEQIVTSIGEFDGSITGGVEAVFGIFDAFKTSATFRFMVTMAGIGDIAMISAGRNFSPTAEDPLNVMEQPANRIMKSKIKGGHNALTMRHSAPSSLYLIPAGFFVAKNAFGAQGGNSLLGPHAAQGLAGPGYDPESKTQRRIQSKITQEEANKIEEALETEYMPFYFQDLRTKEVLGFQAFLENISETFSPDYTSYDAFGRIDDVMIYRKTSRTLDFTFHLVASGPEDFDVMYYNFNKLVSLVYPQYTSGKLMQSPDGHLFTMPFSQIPASSPLIRLRVGDLVSTGYSKFNLARLFGMNDPAFGGTIAGTAGEDLPGLSQYRTDVLSEAGVDGDHVSKRFDEYAQRNLTKTFKSNPIAPDYVSLNKGVTLLPVKKNALDVFENFAGSVGLKEGTVGKIVEFIPKDPVSYALYLAGIATPGSYVIEINSPELLRGYGILLPDNTAPVMHFMVNQSLLELAAAPTYTINEEGARHLGDLVDASYDTQQSALQDIQDKTREFFDPRKNAIVRSFESNMGRGLAGVITNMNLDYAESTWETNIGSRAPLHIKITMGFKVIHDITPGLDSDGMLRVPTHNVGKIVRPMFGDPLGDPAMAMERNSQGEQLGSLGPRRGIDAATKSGISQNTKFEK